MQQTQRLFPVLLSLLSLLLLAAAAVPRLDKDFNENYRDDIVNSRDCSVPKRSSAQEAMNELFTCLLETHVQNTEVFRLARQIDFGGIAGNGVTQKPLLTRLYSIAKVTAASESYRRYFDVVSIFTPELGQDEVRGSNELALEAAYLAHLLSTPFIRDTYATLRANNAIDAAVSLNQFVYGIMYDHWFKLYARTSKAHAAGRRESSGFGHVFVGEVKTNDVTGFHSWLQLLLAETQGNFDYKGYVRIQDSSVLIGGIQFSWMGRSKSLSSVMFGVPPEFELALYSACFIVNPGRRTNLSIKGRPVSVQTFYVNHQPESVATAYPIV
ncbi:hypothetical protein BOX15_Mlig005261g2 [Macrostomum lignano]|uniref:Uridylate-specific endoribonuclease n=1 Tax=Macrostomum lignano TaxID=282301 RepID=A0A267H0B8_9PLAT|nr:hypothetical protein BOX15_Mlig005261g2 [Macrostomum lignano]